MTTYHLAQLNIAQMKYPLEHPEMQDFVNAIAAVNQSAETHPGFVWRLVDEAGGYGGATSQSLPGYDQGDTLVNMSVWQDIDCLRAFVRSPLHLQVMRQRRRWFTTMGEAYLVMWWIKAGHIPSLLEAAEKLRHIQQKGPSPQAFNLHQTYPPKGS